MSWATAAICSAIGLQGLWIVTALYRLSNGIEVVEARLDANRVLTEELNQRLAALEALWEDT